LAGRSKEHGFTKKLTYHQNPQPICNASSKKAGRISEEAFEELKQKSSRTSCKIEDFFS